MSRRLIDANALDELEELDYDYAPVRDGCAWYRAADVWACIESQPTVDAVEVVHGRWILTAHEEYANFRWNVTAECSNCHNDKGEIYAGFFSGFPKELARDVVLDSAKSVKLDNYCSNCGADMRGDGDV
jgi:hypothetical protein